MSPNEITNEIVLTALGEVLDPEIGKDLVSLGSQDLPTTVMFGKPVPIKDFNIALKQFAVC